MPSERQLLQGAFSSFLDYEFRQDHTRQYYREDSKKICKENHENGVF